MLPNPTTTDKVKDYDTLQTAKLNANTEAIGAIDKVGSILYRLGLIKDYVIEIGSNANGNWEKWASGKLVQWGRITSQVTMNVADGALFRTSANVTTNLPIAHVGGYETLFGLRNYTLAGIYTNGQANNSFTFYPRSTVSYTNVNIVASWQTIGRWKT